MFARLRIFRLIFRLAGVRFNIWRESISSIARKGEREGEGEWIFSRGRMAAGRGRLGKTSAPLKRPRKIAVDLPRKRCEEMSCAHVHVQPSLGPGRLMATVENRRVNGGEREARGRQPGNDIFFARVEKMQIVGTRDRETRRLSSLYPLLFPAIVLESRFVRVNFSEDLISYPSSPREIVIINNGTVR